ncbi:hypothetical protein [Desulfoprunum benzoelyticum]|nr:hypothetical protein [Desulfoprunum benzoelyticum]
MPAEKFIERLDSEQNISIPDKHYLPARQFRAAIHDLDIACVALF